MMAQTSLNLSFITSKIINKVDQMLFHPISYKMFSFNTIKIWNPFLTFKIQISHLDKLTKPGFNHHTLKKGLRTQETTVAINMK
jgi:hypothetical protein